MSDIFEEVEEGLAADKAGQLWRRFWPFIVGVAAAIIIAVGADSYIKHQRAQAIEDAGRVFEKGVKAIEIEDVSRVREDLGAALDSKTGFSKLAAHYSAGAELRLAGDEKGALGALEKAAEQSGPLADLARIKAAYMKADAASLEEIEAYVAPLVSSETGFAALARELIAAKALEAGDYERARSEYNFLTLSLDATPDVRQRASRALAVLPALTAGEAATGAEDSSAEPESAGAEE